MSVYMPPRSSRRDRWEESSDQCLRVRVVFGWLLMPAGMVTLLAAVLSSDAHAWVPAASVALAAVFIGLWAILTARPQVGTGLRLMPVVLAWWSMTFGLASIAWWWPQQGSASIVQVRFVVLALGLVGLGALLMTFAYWVAGQRAGCLFGRPAHSFVESRSTTTRNWATPLLLSGIALTGRVLMVSVTGQLSYIGSNGTSAVGPLTQVFSIMAQFGPLAVLIAAYQAWVEHRRGAWIPLTSVFAVEAAYVLISGGKEDGVILGLALLLPWMVARQTLPVLPLLLGVAFYVFVLTPFNAEYRATVRQGPGSFLSAREAIAIAPSVARNTLASTLSPHSRQQGTDSSYARIREVDNVAITIQKTPSQVNYRSPFELIEAPFVAVVPRALWSNKPVLDGGYRFSQEYYQLAPGIRTSSAPTIPGDLYRHGGLVVFAFGMAALGLALRSVDNLVGRAATGPLLMLMFILFPLIVKAEIDATALMATIPSTTIVWLTSVLISFPRICRAA